MKIGEFRLEYDNLMMRAGNIAGAAASLPRLPPPEMARHAEIVV